MHLFMAQLKYTSWHSSSTLHAQFNNTSSQGPFRIRCYSNQGYFYLGLDYRCEKETEIEGETERMKVRSSIEGFSGKE